MNTCQERGITRRGLLVRSAADPGVRAEPGGKEAVGSPVRHGACHTRWAPTQPGGGCGRGREDGEHRRQGTPAFDDAALVVRFVGVEDAESFVVRLPLTGLRFKGVAAKASEGSSGMGDVNR